jgi:hypothetical protein
MEEPEHMNGEHEVRTQYWIRLAEQNARIITAIKRQYVIELEKKCIK